jgi:hypothetical protein
MTEFSIKKLENGYQVDVEGNQQDISLMIASALRDDEDIIDALFGAVVAYTVRKDLGKARELVRVYKKENNVNLN